MVMQRDRKVPAVPPVDGDFVYCSGTAAEDLKPVEPIPQIVTYAALRELIWEVSELYG